MQSLNAPLFTSPDSHSERKFPRTALFLAAAAVALVLAGLLFFGKRHHSSGSQPLPLDAYAAYLPIGGLAMSESTSLSGGKSTFLDGTITNDGPNTVTGITVQVFFHNDENLPPHLETLPLAFIRTREPYVDTQPVSANPIRPGSSRPFRLIFESIPSNWNTQLPEVHIVGVQHQ